MTEEFGICKNKEQGCSLAEAGKPIPITDGELACPECSETMVSYKQPIKRPPIFALVGTVVMMILIVVGFLFWKLHKAPEPPAKLPENAVTNPPAQNSQPEVVETTKPPENIPTPPPEQQPKLAANQCPDNSVEIDAKTYSIGNEYAYFLDHYKDRYKAVHGGGEPLEIDINNAFCLQLTEVSVAEFKQFLNSGPYAENQERLDLLKARISVQKDTAPVQNVSKEEAEAYAVWLSEKTSQHWQLPTLAQWMAAVTVEGEKSPVTNTLDSEPAPARSEDNGKVQHLLGNLREWSRDECPGGRYQLLGRNYIAGDGVDMAYCNAPTMGSPGVGFRLVYQLDGE